jgi:hypothetical protein
VVVIDRADDLLGVPSGAHFAPGIAGIQQAQQLRASTVVEAFVGAGEQPAGPVERIVLVAPVAEGLVLDPAANLIETLVGQLDQVERVRDLGRPGQHGVEGEPPRAGQVQDRPVDPLAPRGRPGCEPPARAGGGGGRR